MNTLMKPLGETWREIAARYGLQHSTGPTWAGIRTCTEHLDYIATRVPPSALRDQMTADWQARLIEWVRWDYIVS